MKARFAGTCAICGEPFARGAAVVRGELIAGEPRSWSHEKCWRAEERGEEPVTLSARQCERAVAAYERNRERVLAGETFAARTR